MYRMTIRQAIGLDPGQGDPIAPSAKPTNLAAEFLAAQGVPISSVLRPVYPTPITFPPASTGPGPSTPPGQQPGAPPTLAVPPGTTPVTPPLPAPPSYTPGDPGPPSDVVDPTAPPPGNGGGITGWWSGQSADKQMMYAAGGVVLLGGLAYLAFGRGKMRPNRAAPPKRATGEVITLADGQRWGHTIPPKEYRTQGATRKSDYAWPSGYKYPLVFRDRDGRVDRAKSASHVRSAASYFARYKDNYPPRVRREIAKNINQAKKRFDVGGKPATP